MPRKTSVHVLNPKPVVVFPGWYHSTENTHTKKKLCLAPGAQQCPVRADLTYWSARSAEPPFPQVFVKLSNTNHIPIRRGLWLSLLLTFLHAFFWVALCSVISMRHIQVYILNFVLSVNIPGSLLCAGHGARF